MATTSHIPQVLKAAMSACYLSSTTNDDEEEDYDSWAHFYDLSSVEKTLHNLTASFPSHFLHAFAVKANPLRSILELMVNHKLGMECASFNEVLHSINNAGCAPSNVVFDSPCKTHKELDECLKRGVLINCDNFDEMERVAHLIEKNTKNTKNKNNKTRNNQQQYTAVQVGLRINPLLGLGTIEALSVSTTDSKFGIPLTTENRQRILKSFQQYSWLTGLHSHVGSQGCGIDMLIAGVQCLVQLANDIDAYVRKAPEEQKEQLEELPRIQFLDIGGGLPTNFESDECLPTFEQYATCLKKSCPDLFEMSHRRVITEFGRAIICKAGWTCSRVEFVKVAPDETHKRILITHAGSDMFLRTCYCPQSFPLRIFALTENMIKQKKTNAPAPLVVTDVAGPLCFGGDKIGRAVLLPSNINVGDFVVVRDTGANCLSMWSRHCSRSAPQVIGYRTEGTEIELVVLKAKETPEQVLSFWG